MRHAYACMITSTIAQSDISCQCCNCGLPNLSGKLSVPIGVDTAGSRHSSRFDISRASSLLSDYQNRSNLTARIGYPVFQSTPRTVVVINTNLIPHSAPSPVTRPPPACDHSSSKDRPNLQNIGNQLPEPVAKEGRIFEPALNHKSRYYHRNRNVA